MGLAKAGGFISCRPTAIAGITCVNILVGVVGIDVAGDDVVVESSGAALG